MSANETNLPVVGGFDDDERENTSLIIGAKASCKDGVWSANDGSEMKPETRYLVRGILTAAQHWQNNRPVETIIKEPGKPFIDIDEANGKVPMETWEKDLNGGPRPPWQITRVVYLFRVPDGKLYTHLNSTYGTKIAVGNLREQIKVMRSLRGVDVVPIVRLDKAPFKTRFGMKIRPDFVPVVWREIGGGPKPVQIEPPKGPPSEPVVEQIGKPVEPVTTKELLNDEIPF
jgi:hypothetical protein